MTLLLAGAILLALAGCGEEVGGELCYRIAVRAEDDGWVYVFDNQYLDTDEDYGSQSPNRVPFSFGAVNLRYRYNEGWTAAVQRTDADRNVVTEIVPRSVCSLGESDSQAEAHDMEKIAGLLGYDRAGTHLTTEELLALTPEDWGLPVSTGSCSWSF